MKEFEFQSIELSRWNATHSSIVGVVVVGVVKELCSDHDAGDEQTMNIEGCEEEAGVLLNDAIQIDDCEHKAFRAAIRVFHKSLQIGLNRDGRRAKCMKDRQLRRVQRHLVIALGDLAKHTRESGNKLLDIKFIWIRGDLALLVLVVIILAMTLVVRAGMFRRCSCIGDGGGSGGLYLSSSRSCCCRCCRLVMGMNRC